MLETCRELEQIRIYEKNNCASSWLFIGTEAVGWLVGWLVS